MEFNNDNNESNDNNSNENTSAESNKNSHGNRGAHKRRGWIAGSIIIGIAASAFAFNAYSGSNGGCQWWPGHGGFHEGHGTAQRSTDIKQHTEWMVDRMMSEVNATDIQKTKAREIADAAANDLQGLGLQHRNTHQELVAILSAPTLDRSKLEALRASAAESIDKSSQRITVAMGDLAEVLTPAQRMQLVNQFEKMHRFVP